MDIDYDDANCIFEEGNENIKTEDRYTPDFTGCVKCKRKLKKWVYQSRCGHLYCDNCIPSVWEKEHLKKCEKCQKKPIVLYRRNAEKKQAAIWNCLCFCCYYQIYEDETSTE